MSCGCGKTRKDIDKDKYMSNYYENFNVGNDRVYISNIDIIILILLIFVYYAYANANKK